MTDDETYPRGATKKKRVFTDGPEDYGACRHGAQICPICRGDAKSPLQAMREEAEALLKLASGDYTASLKISANGWRTMAADLARAALALPTEVETRRPLGQPLDSNAVNCPGFSWGHCCSNCSAALALALPDEQCPKCVEREAAWKASAERLYAIQAQQEELLALPDGEERPRDPSIGTAEQETWASQFSCDRHGVSTWATVRTDKCCGVADPKGHHGGQCGRLLTRGAPSRPLPEGHEAAGSCCCSVNDPCDYHAATCTACGAGGCNGHPRPEPEVEAPEPREEDAQAASDLVRELGAYASDAGIVIPLGTVSWLRERLAAFRSPAAPAPAPESQDNPDLDCTDATHPAWWRGQEYGAHAIIRAALDVLDGRDDGSGTANEPWEGLRRRLLVIVAPKQGWDK